jgi:hypothetical protein
MPYRTAILTKKADDLRVIECLPVPVPQRRMRGRCAQGLFRYCFFSQLSSWLSRKQ